VRISETVSGKYYALRTLTCMIAWFANWDEIWRCYRNGLALPALRFRRGFTLNHRPGDQILLQFYETLRDKSYRRFITEPGHGTVLDLGANIGVVTVDWANRLPALRIHAYEPHPSNFATLCENVQTNGLTSRVSLHQEAIGRSTGRLHLRASELSMETSAYSTAGKYEEFSAPMVTLATVVQRCKSRIALAKMDVEGAEVDILEGASSQILNEIDQFVIEYHDGLVTGARERCELVLNGAGFRCATRRLAPDQGLLYAWRA
jgi:FkbM family methyltransferase